MPNTKTTTTSRTATAAITGNPLDPYKGKLATWPGKFAGAKPTAEQFKTAHALGARPGTKTAMAIAMYLRPTGATQGQVFNVNGGPYLNKMRALIEAGQAVRQPMPANNDGHTVYKLALPTKGASKAAAKGKGKPRKAKAAGKADKPVEATTSHSGGVHDAGNAVS